MRTDIAKLSANAPAGAHALVHDLIEGFQDTADEVVPWFLANMPLVYFQDTDRASQLAHLRAIIAAKASGRPLELTLRNEDGSEWTSMRPRDAPGVLAELAAELPDDPPLRAAKIHTATGGQLVLCTFVFGAAPPFDPHDPVQAEKLAKTIASAAEHHAPSAAEISQHFRRCSAEYILTVTPLRLFRHMELYRRLSATDGTAVLLEPESDRSLCRIVVAACNVTRRRMLERIARRLAFDGISIHRAYLDVIMDPPHGEISLMGFVVQTPEGGPIDESSPLWANLRRDLRRNKWVEHRTLQLAYRNRGLGVPRAEILTGLSDLTHQLLVKTNAYAFSPQRMLRLIEQNLRHATLIADLFIARFDPAGPLADGPFAERLEKLAHQIESEVDLEDARVILGRMLDAVRAVRRTNFFIEERYALALRIDPRFLATEDRREIPFGVFFVHGRGFNGFHVRFRDIARGGLRVIVTRSDEQHALEVERLYDEAYNLAFAQQLKNKDIPEGGAKAAVLMDQHSRLDRTVKGFVDALLDLITPDPAVRNRIVDHHGQEELLYLGPDENITPEFIEWIVDRAKRRGYALPTALMSSKPGAGINHKEYGVTSEGVTVFLEVALRAVGIDPRKQPFTVKMTGGPDGDVGGNMINIMKREFGKNARIVGIADGSGSGEDPAGFDLDELVRLFRKGEPIASFDRRRLSPKGRIVAIDEPDGVRLRNTLHNRVVADAFVPCGGRPNAIHGKNWKDYLRSDGTPSSRVIVEGANLFLTPEARARLSEKGAMILKDSSANKCGVITSSYEIISNMLITEEEFLRVKSRFVEEVKTRLRAFARREAELLVRIHRHTPDVPLPEVSTRLSRVMLRTADAIEASIDRLEGEDAALMRQLVVDHLPPVLLEVAGDRVWSRTPRAYMKMIMAKTLAARIVYREGIEYLEEVDPDEIAELALRYLRLERERDRLASEVEGSTLPRKQRIATVLRQAGILSTFGEE
jgi:glutamate dehydrogenase